MNNEDKILAMLEQLQQGQAAMQGDIAGLKQGQTTTNARLDKMDSRFDEMDSRLDKMDSRFDEMDSRLDTLEKGQTTINSRLDAMRDSQVIVENVWFPKVLASLDGVCSLIEQKYIDRERITALEEKVEELDIRTISLVPKRKTL